MNFVQRLGAKLFNVPQEREVVKDVKVAEENKELRIEIVNLKGQLGRTLKTLKRVNKEKEDVDLKREIAEKLQGEAARLEQEDLGNFYSLDGYYAKLFGVSKEKRSKWAEKVVFHSNDGAGAYPYGEMGFTSKGYFVVKDKEKNIVNVALLPRKLFRFEAFENLLAKGIIPLNVDKEGEYTPEFDQVEIPAQIYDEDQHMFVETQELQVKAKDFIRDKIMENRSLRQTVEHLELTYNDILADLNGLRSKLVTLSKSSNITRADFSAMLDQVTELRKFTYENQQKIVNLSETAALQEDQIDSLETQRKKLGAKAEIVGSNTTFENAKSIIEDVSDSVISRTPKLKPNQ